MRNFKKIWSKWKIIAHRIGVFQAKLIITIVYILILPLGFARTLFKDILKIKKIYSTSWLIKTKSSRSLFDLKNQY